MDPLNPIYPHFSSSSESNASNGGSPYPSEARPDADLYSSLPKTGQSSSKLSVELARPEPHLYSPTRAKIESHPIRQRLSLTRDEIFAGYGTAPEATSENSSKPFETGLLDSRQAQEGSDRLFDAMSSEAPNVKEGDAVTYAWGSGQPGGVVSQVETNDDVTMETKSGNEVKKHGEPENPALYIERSGHDVVKKASEVEVEEKADKKESEKKDESEDKKEDEPEEEDKEDNEDEEDKKQENGEPQTGDKRPAEESAEEKKDEETNGDAKKQKTDDKPKENGEQPKKKGRPAKTDADGNPITKKDTKKRPPKKAATESGEPRRSGRNASKSD